MTWQHGHIKRIILDLALKATGQPFTGDSAFYARSGADWKDDLGLDSIELMELAALVNSFFDLFGAKNPPYLLSSNSVDEWVGMVLHTRSRHNQSINFNTSGTSGNTKTVQHTMVYLNREIDFLADALFSQATCIIPYVPSYTIYGFLLTVGVPQKSGIPVLYPSEVNWQGLPPGALIVGTPFNWQWLISSMPGRPLNCLGVSAAAPLYDSLFRNITSIGVNLIELYGSTETSGVGYRQHEQEAFRLFPYWEFTTSHQISDAQTGEPLHLMDEIQQLDDNTFTLAGRKDKQVKIAGKLVDLEHVARIIQQLSNVKQCDISAKMLNNTVVLQASVVLENNNDEALQAEVKAGMKNRLQPHEMPRYIYFS